MQEVQTQTNRKLKEIKSDVLLVEGICELSSEHINVKHKILEKDKFEFEFETLIDRMMLSDQEEQMMRLYYIKHKTFNQIADELGYSEVGIARMHQRIIKKVRKYI
nr:MAG TPA: DNA-directed RNA polymerase specialized sigma subunit [Caudoviricetes sp.]